MEQRRPELAAHHRPLNGRTLGLRALDLAFDLVVAGEVAEVVEPRLAGLRRHDAAAPEVVYQLVADGAHVWLREDGTNVFAGDLASSVFELLTRIGRRAVERAGLAVHATTVVHEGAGIVLTGPSGAGKSTAAAAALTSGFALLAEDITAIDDAGAVRAFHRPLAVDARWVGAAGPLDPSAWDPTPGDRILVAPDALGPVAVTADRVSIVALVDRSWNGVEELSLTEALGRLADQRLLSVGPGKLRLLAELVGPARCVRLGTATPRAVPELLRALLDPAEADPFWCDVDGAVEAVVDPDGALVATAGRMHRLNRTAATVWMLDREGLAPPAIARQAGLGRPVVDAALDAIRPVRGSAGVAECWAVGDRTV